MRALRFVLSCVLGILAAAAFADEDDDRRVLEDRSRTEAEGYWIHGDFQKGVAEAKRTGKPIVVTLRCVPCQECVKLDDEVIHADQRLRKLLDQFVRVRLISTNGLDLSIFQFDTDQSYAMFFLNADGTIYGRFGTRSHRTEWHEDVSFDGLALALAGALELHEGYPANKASLAGKKGPKPEYRSPDRHPLLKEKYGAALNYEEHVAESCIHCHQVGEAQRLAHVERGEVIPDRVLFSYPHPKVVGLILDPDQKATVREVAENSPAGRAGFQAGDRIESLDGQPLLSIADVQWVLHFADAAGDSLAAQVQRGDETIALTLELPAAWRERDDISWRGSTWEMRRIANGALWMEPATPEERKELRLPRDGMAFIVRHVGQYPPHDAAKNSGFLHDDVVVSFDGKSDFARETDLLAYLLRSHRAGREIDVDIMRDGRQHTLTLKLP